MNTPWRCSVLVDLCGLGSPRADVATERCIYAAPARGHPLPAATNPRLLTMNTPWRCSVLVDLCGLGSPRADVATERRIPRFCVLHDKCSFENTSEKS
jgi:hypothetical protein